MNAKYALAQYRSGMSIAKLAKLYDIPESRVRNRLRNANGGHPLTNRSRNDAVRLGVCASKNSRYKAINDNMGKNYSVVGEVLGLSASTIQRLASQAA